VTGVYHHFAHASALCGEHHGIERWLVFTWDGLGYGADETLWGGEALLGHAGRWRRLSTFRPFHQPGGEKAALQPWRSALAVCWEAGVSGSFTGPDVDVLYQAWKRRINCPQTSAVGRLFDAAATLVGLVHTADYDGQAPMFLEAAAQDHTGNHITLPLTKNTLGIYETDWQPLLYDLMDTTITAGQRAANFHASLAYSILSQARRIRDENGAFTVGLSGGVFQNRLLTEQTVALLKNHDFDVRTCERLPCNDAGLSFGQIIEAASRMSFDA
jgi:hydrogenase maturation protein HypF